MGAQWDWYRFKPAVMRGSIHCHGIAKLKSDPGLFTLIQVTLKGHNTQEELSRINFDLENIVNLKEMFTKENL